MPIRSFIIPLSVLTGAALIAGAIAIRPAAPDSRLAATPATAATSATDPGALVPYLRVTGTGTTTMRPDRAQISVGVSTTGKTSQIALDEASKKMEVIIARMKELGVQPDDLQTGGVNTYEDVERGVWRADQYLTVTVRNVDDAGRFLTEASAAGATNVSGPSFTVSDTKAAYSAAMRKAVEDASAKAEAIAEQIGVRVAGVVSVDDLSGGGGIPIYARDAAAESAAGSPVPVEPGVQEISATVTVVFAYTS